MTSRDAPMEPADQGGGGAALLAATAPAPVLRRQLSYTCSRGRCEPMHDRRLTYSYSSSAVASLSSPASSTSSRSYHVPMSNKSSCESIPVPPELEKQPSFSSSTSSYESFFQLEAADLNRIPAATAMQAPAVQTMMVLQEQQPSAGGYDPRRLPSSMFRTQSSSSSPTDMVDWSVTTNDSLFSIQLPHSGDLSVRYNNSSGDLYYDAAAAAAAGGLHRLPSAGHDASWRLSAVSERLSAGRDAAAGGGLCVSDSCARCSTGGKNRKSVRFASAAEIVSGDSNHSAVFPTLADVMGEAGAAAATEGKKTETPGAAAQWWCAFRCCWPSPPSVWWPRCGCGRGCCGEYCRC
ncbi:hypothetical protein E2562_026895 [Oryza meyeriana var. granulata]|uniref:Uncharacterized protein n=1 Tax=Oryza meyeriana var. granulata TaxID=110450 RepID=A0A6G1EPR2_9ORYZ|nr:hypothetical protein E2562_026895 [Oryza meyeriana var. granulata]